MIWVILDKMFVMSVRICVFLMVLDRVLMIADKILVISGRCLVICLILGGTFFDFG